MPSRFEADFSDPDLSFDPFIDEVFSELRSSFLVMPKGEGFVDYATFEAGYESLKRATGNFECFSEAAVMGVIYAIPISLVVLRTILGFTPSEWAYVASERTGVEVGQGAARSIDRKVRVAPLAPMRDRGAVTDRRIHALVSSALQCLDENRGEYDPALFIHRLDKFDTVEGTRSLRPLADLGVPYSVLLYERFMGRPFAGHRDAVSVLVGDVVESAVEAVLAGAGVSNRKTKRAERIAGFDQAPDFIIPNEFNPAVIIEAKLTEDDGTARDKVARIQNLRALRDGQRRDYEVVACISGRGFKVRREDMRRLLQATDGKVFTLETVDRILDCTRIREFVTVRL